MEEMTLEQQRAMAIASARLRLQQQQSVSTQVQNEVTPQVNESAIMRYGVRPVNELAGAVVEPLLTMGTGLVGKVASDIGGLAAIPLHAAGIGQKEPAQAKENIQTLLQYQPKTELGKLTTKPLELLGSGIESIAELGASPIENEYVRAGIKEALMQAPGLAGARLSQIRAAKGVKAQAMQTERDAIKAAAESKGLITPPESGIKKFAYKTGKVSDEVSLKNMNTITSMVAEDVGLPKGRPITPDLIAQRRASLNTAYDNVASELKQGINITPKFENTIKAMNSYLKQKQIQKPKTFDQADALKISNEHLHSTGKVIGANEVMDDIAALRERAAKADTAGDIASAKTYRKIADSYENLIADNLKSAKKSDVYSSFEDARRQLAKLHIIEKSVDSSGLVNPVALKNNIGTSLKKRKYVTGNMDIAAKFAEQFGNAAKYIKPEDAATLGKWEVTVPLSAIAQAGATGAGVGAGFGSGAGMMAGGAALALPGAISMLAPKLGTAGLLQTRPSYVPYKTRATTAGLMTAPFINKEEQ